MNNYIWAALFVVLFLFTLWRMKVEYRRGYKKGAEEVLVEWKKYMIDMEDIKNDDNHGSL